MHDRKDIGKEGHDRHGVRIAFGESERGEGGERAHSDNRSAQTVRHIPPTCRQHCPPSPCQPQSPGTYGSSSRAASCVRRWAASTPRRRTAPRQMKEKEASAERATKAVEAPVGREWGGNGRGR